VGIGSIPLEHTIEQPAVILATQRQQIYAPASGQIAELAVRSGQIVEAGEPILVMRNDKLADELANLQITRQLTMVERDGSRAAGKLDAVATQTAKLQQIEKDIAYHQAKLEQMVIRAPFAGRFQSPHRLEAMIGASLRQGDEIGLLLEDARRIVAVVVTQDDASMLEPGMAARVRLWGAPWQTWEATVKRVGTQFIEKLPHDALAADHKGEVDTVPSERYKSSPSQPSVLTTLELDSASALPSDGMTGRGKIVIGRSSLITQSMRTLRQVVSLDWWL
jgi:putative peptide zinc metalloprotease protein